MLGLNSGQPLAEVVAESYGCHRWLPSLSLSLPLSLPLSVSLFLSLSPSVSLALLSAPNSSHKLLSQ